MMEDNSCSLPSTTFTLTVNRKPPELIRPTKPTPHEFKPLSYIDDQPALRVLVPIIHFYSSNANMRGKDPVGVIREAISNALVFYYPFAGRLRQVTDGNRLAVECTGEGLLFIEGDADATLDDFGDLRPPFIGIEDLLYHVPVGIVDSPLAFIQVTRLKCGGFVFSSKVNHIMCDGFGMCQFFTAIGELARGLETPTILPLWERHIFNPREKPQVTHSHPEFEDVKSDITISTLGEVTDMVQRTFVFSRNDISALRSELPSHLHDCSTLDILLACIWRSRTIALSFDADEEVRIISVVNARNKPSIHIPKGYYGNAFAICAAISRVGSLVGNPLHYAIELVKEIKYRMTGEYMKSLIDFMVTRGRPP